MRIPQDSVHDVYTAVGEFETGTPWSVDHLVEVTGHRELKLLGV